MKTPSAPAATPSRSPLPLPHAPCAYAAAKTAAARAAVSSSAPARIPSSTAHPASSSATPPPPTAQMPPHAGAPGRPSLFSRELIVAICSVIAERGLSDSAAAKLLGVSTSTLSRWKQEHEDLSLLFHQAREQFRQTQLDIILAQAAQGGGRGWRAAAWLLERVFPEDYAPRAAERARFQTLAERNEIQASAAATNDAPLSTGDIEISRNSTPAHGAASVSAPKAAVPLASDVPHRAASDRHLPSEDDFQNSRNGRLVV